MQSLGPLGPKKKSGTVSLKRFKYVKAFIPSGIHQNHQKITIIFMSDKYHP